nr:putative ribonuclease H-like domain-containing protein [Tanacetum cinerariifolium]
MAESQCNNFMGDKEKVILVLGIRVILLALRETMQADRQGLLNATTVKTEDLDMYDSDFDDISNAQAILMANISIYGSDVISEKAQWIKPTLYDGIVIFAKHVAMPMIDDEETLILEEERSGIASIRRIEQCGIQRIGNFLESVDFVELFVYAPNVFLLANFHQDETSPILKTFVTGIENQLSLKVKVIISDNGTEFKNSDLNQFYGIKGIKRQFNVPRTPQQNSIAEKKNMTLIEAARTMLADSLLPIPFWAEAVNTACYNKEGDATFNGQEHDAEKPESAVNLSPSGSALSREQDDMTKKKDREKSPV